MSKLTGKFVVLKNKKLHTYTNYNDIPDEFEHLIEFKPDVPPEPHQSEAEHEEIAEWAPRLQETLKKGKGNASRM